MFRTNPPTIPEFIMSQQNSSCKIYYNKKIAWMGSDPYAGCIVGLDSDDCNKTIIQFERIKE